jgi:hypothetical protein
MKLLALQIGTSGAPLLGNIIAVVHNRVLWKAQIVRDELPCFASQHRLSRG